MSKYKDYPNWHEIKDLAMIYHEREWDNARVQVWDPKQQKQLELVFCGSTRPHDGKPGIINFIVQDLRDVTKELYKKWDENE